MEKPVKQTVTPKWLGIKNHFERYTNNSTEYGKNFPLGGSFHLRCLDFAEDLAKLTEDLGFAASVEGVKLDLWKDRIWNLILRAGLMQLTYKLPKDEVEKDDEEYYKVEDFGDNDVEPSDDELREIENIFL